MNWEPWASCDSTCGKGRRKRRRTLDMKAGGDLPESTHMLMGLSQLYEENRTEPARRKVQQLEQGRSQELLVAFAGGWACLAALAFALQRVCRRGAGADLSSAHVQLD
jgi:hypothetical protein